MTRGVEDNETLSPGKEGTEVETVLIMLAVCALIKQPPRKLERPLSRKLGGASNTTLLFNCMVLY